MIRLGEFLHGATSVPGTLACVVMPWVLLLLYLAYYYYRRPRELSASAVAPFVLFMDYLTDGATAGYDKPLMSLFHPELLGNVVERGLVRAMVRCLCKRLGKVTHIPRDTAMIKSKGNQVNFVALVDFQCAKQVKCRMSWVWCPPKELLHTKTGFMRRFYVTGFRVEPQQGEDFDVLEFLRTEDFVPYAERFVEGLFERPPRAAVGMMIPALQKRYVDDLEKLQQSIQHVSGAAPDGAVEVNATLMSEEIVRAPASAEPAAGAEDGAMQGIEMRFLVSGVGRREVEVTVSLVFAELRCFVNRYEVRARPDTRVQVVLDHDTGEKTIVA
ncbi:hypothetical protein DQ04_01121150 [Trypanosoma grayi]|uniref:hypothetical protein n=1 Tax=Trypanosoma grayi TaxID=71804 RepID=UPI0004F45DDA|nr:hypothetical protein DQ04_01121150 [Trypanosoma grayi]KEG13260.1 hypothetical protein DQ04_01121150 [Trypanosoma grayi]